MPPGVIVSVTYVKHDDRPLAGPTFGRLPRALGESPHSCTVVFPAPGRRPAQGVTGIGTRAVPWSLGSTGASSGTSPSGSGRARYSNSPCPSGVSPAPVTARRAVGEIPVLIRHHLQFLGLRERARHGCTVVPLLLEIGDGGEPLILVHRVPRDQEREQIPHARIGRHVVEPARRQPALAFRRDVQAEIGQEVAARGDIRRGPAIPHGIGRHGAEAPTMACCGFIAAAMIMSLGVVPLQCWHPRGCGRPSWRASRRVRSPPSQCRGACPVFDGTTAVPSLEEVLHRHAHLSPLTADQFLELLCVERIRTFRAGVVLHAFQSVKHEASCRWCCTVGDSPMLQRIRDAAGAAQTPSRKTGRQEEAVRRVVTAIALARTPIDTHTATVTAAARSAVTALRSGSCNLAE